ncbi:flagellar protein FlaG [Clostridium sp. 'deep sea']|uniref:flagellar protein FlaG n=1 Tax=Clostridium sp. 'deep sea' TaxID=2779445 RepID=UPI0018965173|nr:flagellar protein FlaG [Clostridium sp. 'deep sea']QOR35367.1 flagellar protein FlaG [Clostridium sp. 'deep sea']
MINSINPVDSIVIQLNNSKLSNNTDPDKFIKQQNNSVQINLDIKEDQIIRAVENVNKSFMLENKRMEYDFQDETNTIVIRIIDAQTDEVIKQIPSQKLLDYAAGLMEYIGLNLDTKI